MLRPLNPGQSSSLALFSVPKYGPTYRQGYGTIWEELDFLHTVLLVYTEVLHLKILSNGKTSPACNPHPEAWCFSDPNPNHEVWFQRTLPIWKHPPRIPLLLFPRILCITNITTVSSCSCGPSFYC